MVFVMEFLKNKIISEQENDKIGADIDYDDPILVRDLLAHHLARILIATHAKKIKKLIDNEREKRS